MTAAGAAVLSVGLSTVTAAALTVSACLWLLQRAGDLCDVFGEDW